MSARSRHGRVTARGRARQLIWLLSIVAVFGAPVAFQLAGNGGGAMLFVGAIVAAMIASFAVAADADRDEG